MSHNERTNVGSSVGTARGPYLALREVEGRNDGGFFVLRRVLLENLVEALPVLGRKRPLGLDVVLRRVAVLGAAQDHTQRTCVIQCQPPAR